MMRRLTSSLMRLMAMSREDLDAELRLMFLTIPDEKNPSFDDHYETDYDD